MFLYGQLNTQFLCVVLNKEEVLHFNVTVSVEFAIKPI